MARANIMVARAARVIFLQISTEENKRNCVTRIIMLVHATPWAALSNTLAKVIYYTRAIFLGNKFVLLVV